MKLHWKVLSWMLAGVLLGLALQYGVAAPAWAGGTWKPVADGLELEAVVAKGPLAKSDMKVGGVAESIITNRGADDETTRLLRQVADFDTVLADSENGDLIWLLVAGQDPVPVTLAMSPSSTRALILRPFVFIGDIFMALLKMLIVPLVMSSIITGVAGVGTLKDLQRLGSKTFLYYVSTSVMAIVVGQVLVNLVRPGQGAKLGLSALEGGGPAPDESFIEVIKRMVPTNIVEAMTDNGAMLAMIFFALLFGFFITRTAEPQRSRMHQFFEAVFAVMLRMAEGILKLLPYGVFALIVAVVGRTGFSIFKPLLLYMATVTAALVIHAGITLPAVLRLVGGVSPIAWARAMSPALVTAFSTSSSSMTLPITLETVEKRGKVSNKITSFTLPLGATINMDGTALYECIGVIFLAQYYASAGGDFVLTLTAQATVVVLALMASIGAAGIPSAGLVMMLTILSALDLPLEGAALLLAVDRPLDMMRTMVNVWSDSCGAAVIARSEGESDAGTDNAV